MRPLDPCVTNGCGRAANGLYRSPSGDERYLCANCGAYLMESSGYEFVRIVSSGQ